MEQLVIQLVLGLIESVPTLITAIQTSQSLDETEKKKLLDDIHLRLTDASVKVQAVRFKAVK